MATQTEPMYTAVTLTADEWNIVNAALLCLYDHDTNRNAQLAADETRAVATKIRRVLGWAAR